MRSITDKVTSIQAEEEHPQKQRKHFFNIKVISIVVLIAVLGLVATSFKRHSSQTLPVTNTVDSSDKILSELNEIKNQVQKVVSLKRENPSNSAETYHAQLSALQTMVDAAATKSDIQNLKNEIENLRANFSAEVSELKHMILASSQQKEFLDEKVLPFKVLSVDLLGGKPYVAINFKDKVSPLLVSDAVAGWRLTLADYDAHQAQFMNDKQQLVNVIIHG